MEDLTRKRQDEKQLMAEMISLYCRGSHAEPRDLCDDCRELLSYAEQRIDTCPRMAEKSFCASCPHPCYKPEMREKVRTVMRYAGPRLIFRHPMVCLRHAVEMMNAKRVSARRV